MSRWTHGFRCIPQASDACLRPTSMLTDKIIGILDSIRSHCVSLLHIDAMQWFRLFSMPQVELDTLNQSGAAVNQLEAELTVWHVHVQVQYSTSLIVFSSMQSVLELAHASRRCDWPPRTSTSRAPWRSWALSQSAWATGGSTRRTRTTRRARRRRRSRPSARRSRGACISRAPAGRRRPDSWRAPNCTSLVPPLRALSRGVLCALCSWRLLFCCYSLLSVISSFRDRFSDLWLWSAHFSNLCFRLTPKRPISSVLSRWCCSITLSPLWWILLNIYFDTIVCLRSIIQMSTTYFFYFMFSSKINCKPCLFFDSEHQNTADVFNESRHCLIVWPMALSSVITH